jgi:predicted heme/steroid binding protein
MNRKMNAIPLLIITFALISWILAGCGAAPTASSLTTPAPTQAAESAEATAAQAGATPTGKIFTADELAKYDGKNGNPAYIAVDGVVYDVTNVSEWKNGLHNGRFQAGKDYTEEIMKSPHGKAKLNGVPVVGTYLK